MKGWRQVEQIGPTLFSKASKTLRRMMDLNRFSQAGVTVATAAVSAAVLYAVYPPGIAFAVLFVVAAHEFGHWNAARHFTRVTYPVFVPLVFMLMGITLVQPTDNLADMIGVYRSGPVWGMYASIALITISLALASFYLAACALSLAFWEVYAVSIGGDGSRIRNARRQIEETTPLVQP